MAMTMFWRRTEIMKEAKTLAMMPMLLASLLMVTMVMVMVTTAMALLTVMVASTANMLVNHLSVVMLSVKEKQKVKTGQQSKGGCDNNLGLDVLNNNETNSGDGNDNVLDENRNNEGGKDIGNDTNVVGKSCDGDNGDGDNSDGIVNSNGGNNSNDVGNPPASGDAVGERKKKVKTGQQSKGGGDNNVGLDVPNHNETNSGDGKADDLDENRKKMKESKLFAMMSHAASNAASAASAICQYSRKFSLCAAG